MIDHERPGMPERLSIERFLDDPESLRRLLKERGTLDFTPYASGLFPASDLPPDMREATGMGMAWFRDNAHVIWALYEAGEIELAAKGGEAVMAALNNNRDILDGADTSRRLPVRVKGDTLANDTEPRVQNDSTGYALWITCRLMREGVLPADEHDLETLAKTVRYLERIEYWHDEDEGHWEEDRRIHVSSIGAGIAGLREAQKLLGGTGYVHNVDIDGLIAKGSETMDNILSKGVTDVVKARLELADEPRLGEERPYPDTVRPAEVVRGFFEKFDTRRREHDAALLFLIEPLRVFSGKRAEQIVLGVEEALKRNIGFARYGGDTYWEPRFPDIMSIDERTTAAEGRTEKRNQTAAGVGYSGTEAQWTLFDPVLATYWGQRYEESGDSHHREKQLEYLQLSLDQLVPTDSGELHLPEAYYYAYDEAAGKNKWVPNDHTPLLWSQANLLRALRVFEQTSPVA